MTKTHTRIKNKKKLLSLNVKRKEHISKWQVKGQKQQQKNANYLFTGSGKLKKEQNQNWCLEKEDSQNVW